MTGIASAAALLLAGILAWAGSAKLLRPQATRRAFTELSLPSPAVLARVVPVAEIVVAVALIASPRIGGIAALIALTAMTAVLIRALVRGVDAGCGCFGGSATEPISILDVARNIGLGAAAAASLGTTRLDLDLPSTLLVLGIAALGTVGLGFAQLQRRIGRVWANDLAEAPDAARWAAEQARVDAEGAHRSEADHTIDLTMATAPRRG